MVTVNEPSILGVVLMNLSHECPGEKAWTQDVERTRLAQVVDLQSYANQSCIHWWSFGRRSHQSAAKDFSSSH